MKKLFVAIGFLLLPFYGQAHIVVESEYYLKFIEGQGWTLFYHTKTRALRDVLYEQHPGIKGKNLNSDNVLKKTFDYLNACLELRADGTTYSLQGQTFHYGGHKANGTFLIPNMPETFDQLNIKMNCYIEMKDHFANTIYITLEKQDYLFGFDATLTETTFDSETKTYGNSSDGLSHTHSSHNQWWLWVGLGTVFLAAGIYGLLVKW